MKYCPDCGSEVLGHDQSYCHECGADLSRYETLAHADSKTEGTQDRAAFDEDGAAPEPVGDGGDHRTTGAGGSRQPQKTHSREPIVYDLDELTGHEFEEAIAAVFDRLGYRTELPGKSADRGRDVIAERGGEAIVIECKHQKGNVGRPVVQKLEGATNSYPESTRGLIVTTSGFARTAEEYAEKVTRNTALTLELWDHDRLLKEARQADVYFTLGREDTNLVFRPEIRPDMDARSKLWREHLDHLACEPRDTEEAIEVNGTDLGYTPSVLVDFEVDESFETQTYHIGQIQAEGRGLFPLESGQLTDDEEEHWTSTSYTVACEEMLDGRPTISYFGQPPSRFEEDVSKKLSNRLTRTVTYQGKNNQTYEKRCEVHPSDVSTHTKQVMLVHHRFRLAIGPRDYQFSLTADRGQQWLVSRAEGFRDGLEGLLGDSGFICNDCGLIAPSKGDKAGAECEECGRTLCREHHWDWPQKAPWSSPTLCSECYEAKDHDNHHLESDAAFLDTPWLTGLLGILPGAPFLLGGRWLAAAAYLPVWFLLLAFVAVASRTGNVAGGVFWGGLLLLASMGPAFYWSRRVRAHRANQKELDGYEPEWQPDVRS